MNEKQKIIYNGVIVTAEEVRRAYQQAHPTWRVAVLDAGKQVFIGNQIASVGLWLDKVPDESVTN
jgi:hypothetical protein